jgi:raffinose/stachyose/melibiose transport system substrate-binding protein
MRDDVFVYYAGSLFQGLDPTKNLVELTNEPWQSEVISSYYPGVSVGKRIYGAPFGSAMGGGILYNKAIYKKLGLKIPLTWKAFMENNATIKKAKLIPVIQTYGDSWSAQLLILADAFNLQAAVPTFAALYTSNRVKMSKVPAALAGFQHLADIHKAGYQNKDFATAKLADGLKYLINGQGAHYPMLSFVATDLDKMDPKLADGIGIFAEPGTSAKNNGLTIWMPNGLFIPKSTQHLMTAQNFFSFAVSPAGVAAMNAAVAPSGPYLLKGVQLTGHVSQITIEMQKYFNANGKTAPALEFITPIKGPNLPKISVQVGSGITSALQGASSYDLDVTRESQRLGLPGWGQLPG